MDPNTGKKGMFNKLGRDQGLNLLQKEEFNRKNPNITEIINKSNEFYTYIDSEQKYKYINGLEIPLRYEEYMFEFKNDSLIAVYRGRNNYNREIDYSKYSN